MRKYGTIIAFLCLCPVILSAKTDWRLRSPAQIAAGDLVFRRGNGAWTWLFVGASTKEKRFSHVGIVVENTPNECMIIHAEANDLGKGKVRIEPWHIFFKGAAEGAVYRCTYDNVKPENIVKESKRYLGVSFDNEFDASNDSKIYCSELIMLSINAAAGKTLITPTRRGQYEIIGLDDIYLTGFKKIYDSKLDK